MVKSVPEMLLDSAATFEERSKVYGENYKRFGAVMALLFPTGLCCKSIDDHNRLGVFVQVVSKVTRYAENFHKGGHEDSLIDISVYATMLRELDAFVKESNRPTPEDVATPSAHATDAYSYTLNGQLNRIQIDREGKDYSW